MNFLETWKKIENLCKETDKIKMNQMENIELKNTVTKIKNSVNALNSRIEGIEERISELEDRAREITQSEKERKID